MRRRGCLIQWRRREREEFEKEGLRLAQVLGVLEVVPNDVGVRDVVIFVHVL